MPKAKKTTTKKASRNNLKKPSGENQPRTRNKGREVIVFHPTSGKQLGKARSKKIRITDGDTLADVGNKIKQKLPDALTSSPLLAMFSTDEEALYDGKLDELDVLNIKSVMVVPDDILMHYPTETVQRLLLWNWVINIHVYIHFLDEISHSVSINEHREVEMPYLLRL